MVVNCFRMYHVVLACCALACGGGAPGLPSALPSPLAADTTATANVPAGFGTLRQEDIAIRLEPQGLVLRAVPLDESIIRLLTPDSYRVLRELQESNRRAIEAIGRRTGGQRPDLWYVSFYGVEPETRFSPLEMIISSAGRDFRPIDVIPLTSGFGEQRLRQRETQSAIIAFEPEVEIDHPLTVRFLGERDESWEQILQRIERERAMVRARAGSAER